MAAGNGQFSEVERTEAWRQFHGKHVERQTRAVESIRLYVAIWFWLTVVGALMFIIATAQAASRF